MAPSSIACDGMFHSYFMISVTHCMLEKNQLNIGNVDLFNQKIITHLISLKCNRGIGRNQAFKSSSGQYILANIDTDVIYDYKKILSAIKEYHSRFEGKVLSVYGMMIIPYLNSFTLTHIF